MFTSFKKTISFLSISFIFIVFLLFIGCRKNQDTSKSQNFESTKNEILVWLDFQKKGSNDGGAFIDTLKVAAKWDQLSVSKINGLEILVYVPLEYNSNNTGIVFLINSKNNKIETAYLSEVIYSKNNYLLRSEHYRVKPAELISGFYNYRMNKFSGSITAFSLSNVHLWEMGYEDGNNTYKKLVQEAKQIRNSYFNNNTLSKTVNSNLPKKATDCTAFYEVTYWSDGSVTSVYLGGYCTPPDPCQLLTIGIKRDSTQNSTINVRTFCGTTSGGGGSTTVNIRDTISTVLIFDPCLRKMVEKLISQHLSNTISTSINNTFAVNQFVNLAFSQSNSLPNDVAAGTRIYNFISPSLMDVTITLNSNTLPFASQEYIAETIFHEMLHAQFDHDSTSKNEFKQHMYVAQNWISTECTALTTLFPNLTPTNANALILSGIGGSLFELDPVYFTTLRNSFNFYTNLDISTIFDSYKNNDLGTGCLGAKVK